MNDFTEQINQDLDKLESATVEALQVGDSVKLVGGLDHGCQGIVKAVVGDTATVTIIKAVYDTDTKAMKDKEMDVEVPVAYAVKQAKSVNESEAYQDTVYLPNVGTEVSVAISDEEQQRLPQEAKDFYFAKAKAAALAFDHALQEVWEETVNKYSKYLEEV